jgi:hypothetical protein
MFDRLRKREKEARRCWKRSGVVTSPQSPLPSTPRDRPTPPKPLPRHNPPTFPIRGYLRLSMPISYPPRANARGVRAALLPDHMPSLKPDRRAPCTVVTRAVTRIKGRLMMLLLGQSLSVGLEGLVFPCVSLNIACPASCD